MAYKTWQEAAAALEEATGPATERQQTLGRLAGLTLSAGTPQLVAAALLKVALSGDLDLPFPRPVNDRHSFRIDLLLRPSDFKFSPTNEVEADAWITYLRLVRRREKLLDLEVSQGDIVKTMSGEVAQVSSIGEDGRVYFKGGEGFGAWPDLISVVARTSDSSKKAKEARRQAANTAARRATRSQWSEAKSRDLSDFITEDYVGADDIAELESVIAKAKDERPIQKFLECHGHILTALLGGNERYCLPQKRLGGEYVPDFVVGDVDSLGVRWVLVELETPRSGIYLKDGLSFDEKTRKGIGQVIDWRNWLAENISYARRRRSENGLGLFDIREKSKAIVLVGRRNLIPETKDAQRRECRDSNNIEIHTYDWLLESLQGAMHHYGPPATNPYLVRRDKE